eukprot:343786_1
MENLSPEQYQSFVQTLNRDVIQTALFDHFHAQLCRNNDCSKVQEINDKLSQIVKDTDPTPTFGDISHSLINKIGSYLDTLSYTCFETCSRAMLIALRNPSQLQQCEVFDEYFSNVKSNHTFIDINRFKRLKYIYVNSWELKKIIQHKFRLNSLHELALDCSRTTIRLVTKSATENVINLANVRTLALNGSVSTFTTFDLLHLFTHVPHLEYLEFSDDFFVPAFNFN